jgi:hypothetical protein
MSKILKGRYPKDQSLIKHFTGPLPDGIVIGSGTDAGPGRLDEVQVSKITRMSTRADTVRPAARPRHAEQPGRERITAWQCDWCRTDSVSTDWSKVADVNAHRHTAERRCT